MALKAVFRELRQTEPTLNSDLREPRQAETTLKAVLRELRQTKQTLNSDFREPQLK